MNLSRRARVFLALGSVGAVVGAGATAMNALAVGQTLAFGPTATSATIVDVDPTASVGNAGLTYGLKVTGATGTDPLLISNLTGPGSLSVERVAANGNPTNATTWGSGGTIVGAPAQHATTVVSSASFPAGSTLLLNGADSVITGQATPNGGNFNIPIVYPATGIPNGLANGNTITQMATGFNTVAVGQSANVPLYSVAGNDNIYVGATVPGTYTFKVFQDHNGNGVYEPAQDDITPTFTLTVKDVTGNTAADTTDDLDFVMTAPATAERGRTITASSAAVVTGLDTRGVNLATGYGKLGENIAAAMNFDYTGAFDVLGHTGAALNDDHAPTYNGTTFSWTTTDVVDTGATVTLQPKLDKTGAGGYYTPVAQLKTINVIDNAVTVTALANTDVAGSVKHSGAAVTAKVGTSATTYTATLTDGDTDKSGNVVYWVLTPGVGTPGLTADGTLVSNASGVKTYTSTSNASGVASLVVTSDKTTNTTAYTVDAESNNKKGTQLGTTYATAAPASAVITTTGAALYPSVAATSVSLAGKIVDQFGNTMQPGAGLSQQAQVYIGAAPADQSVTSAALANVVITGGTFTYAYTPSSPTAGTTTGFHFVWDADFDGKVDSPAEVADGTLSWSSAGASAHVNITTPANAAAFSPALQVASTTPIGAGTAIGGTVTDASNTVLPFKSVTLTGGPGMYFSGTNNPGAADPLVTSLTVQASNVGAWTAYVYTTVAGAQVLTGTSDAVHTTVTGTTAVAAVAASKYIVSVDDVSGRSGDILTVTGHVRDGFGNPVATAGGAVGLTLSDNTLGVLSSATATSDANGVFSANFTAGSNASGHTTVTATITASGALSAGWATVGLTVPAAVATDTGVITVAADSVTATVSPASRIGAGTVTVSGTTRANAPVDVYAKAAGTSNTLGWIGSATADASGAWSKAVTVSSSTTFVARSGSATSGEATVTVVAARPVVVLHSTVSLKATALGSGKVKLASNGGQRYGTASFQVLSGKKWVVLGTYAANVNGDVTKTFKTTKGTKTFRVVYTAPGRTAATASATLRVK